MRARGAAGAVAMACVQHLLRLGDLAAYQMGGGLLAQVVRQAAAEAAGFALVELARDLGGLGPVARAFVVGQARQAGLRFEGGAFELEQRVFGAVEQAGLEEVQRQGVLGALAVGFGEVAAREQVFVHAHGALVFATAAEQVAQREVQLGGVGVVLHGLDEGVDGLVLLLVEQEVQAAEVGLGVAPVFDAQLAQVQPRGQPAQDEGGGQAEQNPAQIKIHGVAARWRGRVRCRRRPGGAPGARHGAACHQRGSMPSTPAVRPRAKAASTTRTCGAVQSWPKKKCTVTSCWLFRAKASRVKKMAARSIHFSSHSELFHRFPPDEEILAISAINFWIRSPAFRWCAGPPPRAGPCPA